MLGFLYFSIGYALLSFSKQCIMDNVENNIYQYDTVLEKCLYVLKFVLSISLSLQGMYLILKAVI